MALTGEGASRDDLALFRGYVEAVGGRPRIRADAEGWPEAPGIYGRLEWRGPEWHTGEHRIYAYTDKPRIIAKLRGIAGVHPKQTGDAELAVWMAADDVETVRTVAQLFRLRQRRAPVPGSAERLKAWRY